MSKKRVIVVGAFNNESISNIKGGIRRACSILESSKYFQEFDVKTVDSTQISYPAPSVIVRAVYSIKRLFNLLNTTIRFKPDMVLIFFSNGLSFYEKTLMSIIVKSLGCRSVLFPRGSARFSDSALLQSFNRILLRSANLVLCQGEVIKKYLKTSYGVPEKKLSVIENWTATEDILEIGRKREYGNIKIYRILFVGWIESAKGIESIIDVVNHLDNTSLNYEFHLVGGGSKKIELIENLCGQITEKKVIFHSWLNQEKLIKIYANCHIFFLPSLGEGLPNSLIEAMGAGLVPVTTPVGNIPSVIESNKNGFLCPVRDSNYMIDKIDLLLNNPELLNHISIAARNTAKERFSTNKNINKLIAITKKVIDGKYD